MRNRLVFREHLDDGVDDQLADVQQADGLQRRQQAEGEAQRTTVTGPESQTIFSTGGMLRSAERRSCQALVMVFAGWVIRVRA